MERPPEIRIETPQRSKASRDHRSKRGGIFAHIRPSYLILIIIALGSISLFIASPLYRETLSFLRSGILVTAIATLSGYLGAFILGLSLAALLLLELGRRTVLIFSLLTLVSGLAAIYFFSQPRLEYSVLGSEEGNLAVIAGTSRRAVEQARGEARRTFRNMPSREAVLEALETGAAGAALLPVADAPEDVPELMRVSLLRDRDRNQGIVLGVAAVLLGLLTFGAWSSREHPLAVFAELYIDLVRGIPMLVVLIYVGFVIAPALREASDGTIDLPRLARGIAGLALGYAAYMAEIFRAGIQAVPKGQIEAARSLGLSGRQAMRYVVLPQAIRIVIPPLGNEFIAMLKDSSLLTILSVTEITQLARQHQSRTFNTFETWNTAALLYLALTLAASSVLDRVERRSQASR